MLKINLFFKPQLILCALYFGSAHAQQSVTPLPKTPAPAETIVPPIIATPPSPAPHNSRLRNFW